MVKYKDLMLQVAKNYLTEQELSAMARIVNAYLDLAEMRCRRTDSHDDGRLGRTI